MERRQGNLRLDVLPETGRINNGRFSRIVFRRIGFSGNNLFLAKTKKIVCRLDDVKLAFVRQHIFSFEYSALHFSVVSDVYDFRVFVGKELLDKNFDYSLVNIVFGAFYGIICRRTLGFLNF